MANASAWELPINHILSDSGLTEEALLDILKVTRTELNSWKSGTEPHHLVKRGVIQVLRQASQVSMAKSMVWEITHTDGQKEIIRNLRAWARAKGFNPNSVNSAFSTSGYFGKPKYLGRRLTPEEIIVWEEKRC